MRHAGSRRPSMCNTYPSLVPIILNLLTFLHWATAQVIFSEPSTLNTPTPSVTMPPTTQSEGVSTSSFSSQPSSLLPINPSQPPLESLPYVFIAAEQPQQPTQVRNRVFNYYFLFLALLVAAAAALLWYIHRCRRRGQEQIRLRGQHALVQDVERWATLRRNQPPIVEGLNESGEAPPPYDHKNDKTSVVATANGDAITIPPRVLSRDDTDVQLPDYAELIRANGERGASRHARDVQ